MHEWTNKLKLNRKLMWTGIGTMYRRFASVAVPAIRERSVLEGGEVVSFESADGVWLQGRLFHSSKPTRRAVIFCHEAGSSMTALKQYGWFLIDRGFNILTFNFRAEANGAGRGAQPWVTASELEDLRGAIRFIQSRLNLRAGELGLLGISRGGSTALCTAAREPIIGAVITDGGFDTRLTIKEYLHRWAPRYYGVKHVPPLVTTVCSYVLILFARWWSGQHLYSVAQAISRCQHAALFFIHGAEDQYISSKQAIHFYGRAKRCRGRRLWLSANSDHNRTVFRHGDEYSRCVSEFFDNHLSTENTGAKL